MAFKINIATPEGKTYKLETEGDSLIGKELGEKVLGKEVSADLEGYEFEIAGASDSSGFPAFKEVEGIGLKKLLLKYGKGMRKRPKKEGKKKRSKNRPKGLRLRKTVRGRVISKTIKQINLKITKKGKKSLDEIFPDQAPQPAEPVETEKAPAEQKQETVETTKTEKPTEQTA